jgi:hypothetical protein
MTAPAASQADYSNVDDTVSIFIFVSMKVLSILVPATAILCEGRVDKTQRLASGLARI